MINRYAVLVSFVAATVIPASVAQADSPGPQTVRADAVAREVRDTVREAKRVTRYQGRDRNRVEEREPQRRTFKIAPGGLIELHNIAGDITITAGGGDQVTIEVMKTAHGTTTADAAEQLRLVQVEFIERANGVEVRAHYPDRRARNQRRNISVSTEYRVVAPAGSRIRTDSISGSVSVTGIRGELTLGTISGNITVRDAGQRVSGQTISGNVDLISAQNDAVVELSSTSGNVRTQSVKVRRLDLGSISGSVIARDVQSEAASLHTMSGNVEYAGGLSPGGRYDFRTHSGDVRLTVPQGAGFELEASTFSGEVHSALPLRLEGQNRGRSRTIRGTYGDGRARLEATSFSGNVYITGK